MHPVHTTRAGAGSPHLWRGGGGAAAASSVLCGDVSGLAPESIGASHNDYDAIQLYLAAFVDAFRKDFWAGY